MKKALISATTLLTLLSPFLLTEAQAKQAGDFMMRGRALLITPDAGGTTTIGGEIDVDDKIVPELDFTYFLSDNVAVELIAATAKHNAEVKGSALGDVDLGSVWLLPPTLTLQYHFNTKGEFSPYVGAGVNYTFFYNDKAAGGAIETLNLKDSFGLALQAGFDYKIDEKWSFNVDVKKIILDTEASVNNGAVTSKEVNINPLFVGVGFGYTF